MSQNIHPTAVVSPKAKIGENVSIGAFSVIEDDVTIGANTKIMHHVVVLNGSKVGESCSLFPQVVIGADPQDLRFDGRTTTAIIGDRTVLRECVTVNRGSHTAETRVGNDCLIMAYTHIAHDCIVGNHVVLANATQLGGHVNIGDWAVLGGVTKVHQFCRIGAHCMIAADAMVTKDVPHFALTGRSPVKIEGINKVGMLRRGFQREEIELIEKFYSTVFHSGKNMSDGIAAYLNENMPAPTVQSIIDFIRESKRGCYR